MISSYQQEEELYYMEQKKNLVTLGSTGITVEKNSFGALPIQRISKEAAIGLLRKAYAAGGTFYDTARYYTDSEEKVGAAFEGMRDKIYIATKTGATTAEGFWKELHTSLEKLKTDYIDLYYLHRVDPNVPIEDIAYLMKDFIKQGKIKHWGLSEAGIETKPMQYVL